MSNFLQYDPGSPPTEAAPAPGETIVLELPGLPPTKDRRQSIRNQKHPRHSTFTALRKSAAIAMAGRAWYFGPVELHLTVFGPNSSEYRRLNNYLGGIMDTLDGSSGRTFTYLPIVFQDDCQVDEAHTEWVENPETLYRLRIIFK